MLQELYCDYCAPEEIEKSCPGCCGDERDRVQHVRQTRVTGVPQVLVVQLRRGSEAREPVWVEEQLRLPGLPQMQLVGVVYHNGRSVNTGHYTTLCRVPDGRYFMYDDDQQPRLIRDEPAHIKQKEAYMAVYCRMGRGQGQGAGDGATEVDAAREGQGSGGSGPGGGDASASGVGGGAGGASVGGGADGATEREGGSGAPAARGNGRAGGAAGGRAGTSASVGARGEPTSGGGVGAQPGRGGRGEGVVAVAAAEPRSASRRLRGKRAGSTSGEGRAVDGEVTAGQVAVTTNGGAAGAAESRGAAGGRDLTAGVGGGAVSRKEGGGPGSPGGTAPRSAARRAREKTAAPRSDAGAAGGAVGAAGARDVSGESDIAGPGRVRGARGSGGARAGGRGLGGDVARASVAGGRDAAAVETGGGAEGVRPGAVRAPASGKRKVEPVSEAEAPRRRSARLAARPAPGPVSVEGGAAAGAGAYVRGGVLERPKRAEPSASSSGGGAARVVTGFGAERIENLADYQRGRDLGDATRASQRVAEGTRGGGVDMQGNELDPSAGSAWHAGR